LQVTSEIENFEVTFYPVDQEEPYIAFKVNFNGTICSIKLLTIASEEDDWYKLKYGYENGDEGTALPYDRVGGDRKFRNILEISENQQKQLNNTPKKQEKEDKRKKSGKDKYRHKDIAVSN